MECHPSEHVSHGVALDRIEDLEAERDTLEDYARRLEATITKIVEGLNALEAERDALSISLRVMANKLDASMARVDELESEVRAVKYVRDRHAARAGQLLHALAEITDCANFDRVDPNAVKRWRALLKG